MLSLRRLVEDRQQTEQRQNMRGGVDQPEQDDEQDHAVAARCAVSRLRVAAAAGARHQRRHDHCPNGGGQPGEADGVQETVREQQRGQVGGTKVTSAVLLRPTASSLNLQKSAR